MMRSALALLLLAMAVIPSVAGAETYHVCKSHIQSVPTTISSQGVYCLNKDLSTGQTTGAAILVTTNNVTIDCNGYKLGGLAAGIGTQAIGILASGRQNLTVRNCNIRGFRVGVSASGAGHVIENNTFDKNTNSATVVSGDANLIRDNIVIDTGGGTGTALVHGIYAEWHTDIRGNTVDGVLGSAGGSETYGIRLVGGIGAVVARNIVRNLVPTGQGTAYGIYTSNGQKIFIDDNRVSLPASVASSIGYRCNSSNGALRNNTSWTFATHNSGCLDDGGNASH